MNAPSIRRHRQTVCWTVGAAVTVATSVLGSPWCQADPSDGTSSPKVTAPKSPSAEAKPGPGKPNPNKPSAKLTPAEKSSPAEKPTSSENPPRPAKDRSGADAEPEPSVSPEREAAVRVFVRRHHQELESILAGLRFGNPVAYVSAVEDLFKQSERLSSLRTRDARRYEIELALWKNQSRAQVLAAKLKMRDTPELREELHDLIVAQADLRLARLDHERKLARERLDRVTEQIEQAQVDRSDWIEFQFRRITADRRRAASEKPVPEKSANEKAAPEKPADEKRNTDRSPSDKPGDTTPDRTKASDPPRPSSPATPTEPVGVPVPRPGLTPR